MDSEAKELVEAIAKPFETCRLEAYWDPVGYPTQGWGRLLSRTRLQDHMLEGKTKGECDTWLQNTYPPISQEIADLWLEQDISKAYNSVKRLVKVPLSTGQLAALVDFAFNCGPGNLQISTLLRLVNRLEFADAADEFPKWNKAGGLVLRGLTRRRQVEKKVFLTM